MLASLLLSSMHAAAVEPVTVPGGLFGSDSLRVAPDGTVHALASSRQHRVSALTSQITITNGEGEVVGRVGGPPVRHVALAPDGTLTITPIEGPLGPWPADVQIVEAALDLDPDGQAVVALLSRQCPPKSMCIDQLWLARQGQDGFSVTQVPTERGIHRGLVLRADGPRWLAVSHVSAAPGAFFGFVAWDEGGEQRWLPARRGEPQALPVRDGQIDLLYRTGSELHLYDGQTDQILASGARHGADAVARSDGRLWYGMYDVRARRFRGGTVGETPSFPGDIDGIESGWYNALALVGDRPVAAWYYYRNNYNKGVRLGVLDGETPERWTQIRSETDNVGWGVDLAGGPDGSLALVAHDRSNHQLALYRWPSLEEAQSSAVPDAGDWTDRRRNSFFFAYGGGWYQLWGIDALAPSSEDFSFGSVERRTGTYGVRPGLGVEGGFAGKVGPVDLVLEYLRRNDEDESVQTIHKLQNLFGKLGIEDVPLPDSELQLHLRTSDLRGGYLATDGTAQPFVTGERLVELRYVGKQGYHFGLRYHAFAGPVDVFPSLDRTVLGHWVADGRFTTGSVVAGWSVMDYLKKYEVKFLGPYLDLQGGLGYASALLRPTGSGTSPPSTSTSGTSASTSVPTAGVPDAPQVASGMTLSASGDLGLAAYRRVRGLRGGGGFVRAGVRGWLQLTGNTEPDPADQTGDPRTEPFPNFLRIDRRFGPYLNAGLVF